MTIKIFLAALRKIRGWNLLKDGRIRYGLEGDKVYGCPLTYLANKRLSTEFCVSEAWEAGKKLGLSKLLVGRIIPSADNVVRSPYFSESIRSRLLEACHLP